MRTPVLQIPVDQRELTDAIADGLAALLVAEFKLRHPQHNQQDPVETASPRRGLNRTEVTTDMTSNEQE